ncbi:hypothetical protein K432DRAFT_378895 [Lepidopterella palustris CBS 459.81]|uniref:Glyoxalase-like domain-containing protein n=1 Tax=Lepidopterella palustris CBS 459.81 TaxID=1314670 RepID=A0A8E2JIV8_9PEZI|nr:hypothetical protein K432DRAFT_378895 [Lepidopterella palustris CBS 459.81]
MASASSVGRKSASAPSPTRLRQVAFVTKDLERARYLLTKVLGTEVIFVDPAVEKWGLKNFLVALGGDIIEVVSPTRQDTTAARLLSKRGDGGYMIIMQTADAKGRRDYIESKGLGKVIFSHENEDFVCVQYHPKGIKGGMMPELDAHRPTPENPTPITSRFSHWHACGPDYNSYSAAMKRHSNLHLSGLVCRLEPGDVDHEGAPRQWEEMFGVARSRDLLAFTNARLGFTRGEEGKPEGLVSITIGVEGVEYLNGILERARAEGLCENGWINMLGVKWYFVLAGFGDAKTKL